MFIWKSKLKDFMGVRAWFKRLTTRNSDTSTQASEFPVAAFWRSVCNLKQPVLLVKDGLQIIAATEEAYELLGGRTPKEICRLLKGGLDPHTMSRIELAVANPVAIATELPIRIQSPGLYVNVTVTVSTLPEYPEQGAALLFLKDNRNPNVPLWARTARDLLSRISLPAWVVDHTGSTVFSNGAYAEFPLKLIRAETQTQDGYPDRTVLAQMTQLLSDLETVPAEVGLTSVLADNKYELGPYGKWRVLHFPLKSRAGESIIGAVAMPLDVPVRSGDQSFAGLPGAELMGQDALTHMLQVKEAERTALAREVHDSLGQELTVLKLEMRRLYNMVVGTAAGTSLVVEHFQSVRQLVDNLAKTARRIAYEMRQDLTTGHGLAHSVQELVLDLRERMGLQIQFELLPGWVEPEKGMAHHLHRSLQEMLNNVSKHAKATRCLVRMGLTGTTYILEVRDDGVGMDPERVTHSIGLRSLRERAEVFNGTVTIESRPTVEGTLVRTEMPERRLLGKPARALTAGAQSIDEQKKEELTGEFA